MAKPKAPSSVAKPASPSSVSDIVPNVDADFWDFLNQQESTADYNIQIKRLFAGILTDISRQVLSGADKIVNNYDISYFVNYPEIFNNLRGLFGGANSASAEQVLNNEEFNLYFIKQYGSDSDEYNQVIRRRETININNLLTDAGYPDLTQEQLDYYYDQYGDKPTKERNSLVLQDADLRNFTKEEAADVLDGLGYEYTDEELDQFVINESSDAELGAQNVRDYFDANTVDAKEYSKIFRQVNGRAPTAEEREAFFGEGNNRIKYEESTLQANLETEAKESLWETQIRPALEAGGDFVKKILFGTSASGTGPKTWDEMFEEWMQSQMDQLKGPLTVTVDPNRGLLAEIMIPVGFEVNGKPIELPIFDADGNFVLAETIENVFVNVDGTGKNIIQATIDGVEQTIGEIVKGPNGTFVTRIFDAAGNIVSELGLGGLAVEDGSATGVLTGAVLSGDLFFNPESGSFEEGEAVSSGELLNGDADLNGTAEGPIDENGGGIDDNTGLPLVTEEEPPAEQVEPSAKAPRGRVISDKEGNTIGISGDDGVFYVKDDSGKWVPQVTGETTGEEYTILDGTLTDVTPVDSQLEDDVIRPGVGEELTSETTEVPTQVTPTQTTPTVKPPGGNVITDKDGNIVGISGYDGNFYVQDDSGKWVVQPTTTSDVTGDEYTILDATLTDITPVDEEDTDATPVDNQRGDDVVRPGVGEELTSETTDLPTKVIIDDDDEVITTDDKEDDEQPTVDYRDGVDGKDGVDGIDGVDGKDGERGARGLPGRSAAPQGFMGGLSYQLPGFVGVEYQPKDYMVELNRIIGESLFEGMY